MPAVLLTKPQQPTRSRNLQPGLLPKHWYGGRGQVNVKDRVEILLVLKADVVSLVRQAVFDRQKLGDGNLY